MAHASDTGLQPLLRAPAPPSTLAAAAAAIGRGSELVEAAAAVRKRPDNVLGLLLRPLTREEIAVMEDRGCRADDWALILVAQDFDAFRVRRTHLRGACRLGRFAGEVELQAGISLSSGIYDCTLIDCQVGNDCLLENVRFAARTVIERESVPFDVGSITCSGAAAFACGRRVVVGPETGGREVPLWGELTIEAAALAARERGDQTGQAALAAAVAVYAKAVTSGVCWVRRGARVRHATRLRDVYIGAAAVVDNALEVSDACLLSSADEPVQVLAGASVARSILQWGSRVMGGASVRDSALLEHAGADEHASVASSIVGPNTLIAKGEATSSLIGPFVGFHHQSMLIATLWPEGKGNLSSGALVGSNHTGRAPDQELWAGEGVFFGLGCRVRFPADYSEAPYTVIGMGVTTLPQKVRFPFSLIQQPTEALHGAEDDLPRAYNEILPAWALHANAYGLARTEAKLRARDRSRRHRIDPKVLRPSIMRLVLAARDCLAGVATPKAVYTDADVEGLGKNFLREAVRCQAIEVYDRALLRWCLRILMNEREQRLEIPGSAETAHEIVGRLAPGLDFAARMQLLLRIERSNAELVQSSKERDDDRGARIIPGYADAHAKAADDPIVQSAWERVRRTEERVAALK